MKKEEGKKKEEKKNSYCGIALDLNITDNYRMLFACNELIIILQEHIIDIIS